MKNFLINYAYKVFNRNVQDPEIVPGHNGPYYDPETPVRNTGHWLITLTQCYRWSGDKAFKNGVIKLASSLMAEDARPNGFSFHHRKSGSDACNGLMGQAWTFEALAAAAHCLNDESCMLLAEDVFFQHPFDAQRGLWHTLDIDGQDLSFDPTFNHQLWFAACASLIQGKRTKEIHDRVLRFIECLPYNLTVLDNGLIYHPIVWFWDEELKRANTWKLKGRRFLGNLYRTVKNCSWAFTQISEEELRRKNVYKSVGYHSFNMYAFGLLKLQFPHHSIWESDFFLPLVAYLSSDEFQTDLEHNTYGYPYNPPGFEVPFALGCFATLDQVMLIQTCQQWIDRQFAHGLNSQTGFLDRNTDDPATASARIYELTKVSESILDKINPPC